MDGELLDGAARYEAMQTITAENAGRISFALGNFAPPTKAQRRKLAKMMKRKKPKTQPKVKFAQKLGRNDPCVCGSGVKLKNCCMRETLSQRHSLNNGVNPWQSVPATESSAAPST